MPHPSNHPGRFLSPLQEVAGDRTGRGTAAASEPAGAGGPGAPPCPSSMAGGLRSPGAALGPRDPTAARHSNPTPSRPHPLIPVPPHRRCHPPPSAAAANSKTEPPHPHRRPLAAGPTAPLETSPSFATAARCPAPLLIIFGQSCALFQL